jgi:hypothetical protein
MSTSFPMIWPLGLLEIAVKPHMHTLSDHHVRLIRERTYPPPYLRTTRCTIGISFPLTLYTTISPICVSSPLFHKNSKSPLWNAGSMDPERTTTIGDGELETTESPFQSMNAVDNTSAKLRIWAASCRGCIPARPSMVAVVSRIGDRRSRMSRFRAIATLGRVIICFMLRPCIGVWLSLRDLRVVRVVELWW